VADRPAPGRAARGDEADLYKLGQQHGIKLSNLWQLVGLDKPPRGVRRQLANL